MADSYQSVASYSETTVANSEEKKVVWTTPKIKTLLSQIDDGFKPKFTPFYDGNPQFKRGNIVYGYSKEEIEEIRRCTKDIVYFANNYCTVMTEDGLEIIQLRDYQEDLLEHFKDNPASVCLASRQVGKCLSPFSKLQIKTMLKFNDKYKLSENVYSLPIFELFNIFNKKTILGKIKLFLYRQYFNLLSQPVQN